MTDVLLIPGVSFHVLVVVSFLWKPLFTYIAGEFPCRSISVDDQYVSFEIFVGVEGFAAQNAFVVAPIEMGVFVDYKFAFGDEALAA